MKDIGSQLAGHAHELVSDALKTMSDRVTVITRNASQTELTTNQYSNLRAYTQIGPTWAEDQELKSMQDTSEKIIQFSRDMAGSGEGDPLTKDADDARTLISRIATVPRKPEDTAVPYTGQPIQTSPNTTPNSTTPGQTPRNTTITPTPAPPRPPR